jgi:hypothetical protein
LFFHASRTPAKKETEKPVAQEVQLPATIQEEQPAEGDLSGDWESDFSVEAPQVEEPQVAEPVAAETARHEIQAAEPQALAPPSAVLEEGIEEVRFYLGQGMTDHAERVLTKLEALAQGSPELAVLRLGIESAKQPSGVQLRQPEVSVEEAAPEGHVLEQTPAPPSSAPQPWPQAAPQTPPERPVLEEIVSDLEQSLGDGFVPQAPATKAQATPVAQASVPAATPGQSFRTGTLDEFVADLEASLGCDFTPGAPVAQVAQPVAQATPLVAAPPIQPVEAPALAKAPVARAAAAAAMPTVSAPVPPGMSAQAPAVSATPAPMSHGIESAPGVDLANMFGELKHELEEDVATTDEDPETHYNLGVAFREMGLLDEAIGEFQKVCQAMERGRAFPQIMQTYTWLAQCFLEKGIPEAAIRWYEKALALPSIDQETRTALHYELASSLENAGNKSAALSNFLEVYGRNIDYRDVAERIKALRP